MFLSGSVGCGQCARESRRLSEPELRKRIRRVDDTIELKSVSYPGSKLHLQCKKCGHRWKGLLGNLEAGFCLCRNCHPDWESEAKVRKIIERLTKTKWPKASPSEVPFLCGLHADGYSRKLNAIFEFDGSQHDHVVPHFHGQGRRGKKSFLEAKRRDWRKNIQCWRHGVTLIRIPYRKRNDEGYIKAKLLRMGIT